MKILLVNPPSPGIYNSVGLKLPPLGLGYLASVLQKNHHQVKILDLQVEKSPAWNKNLPTAIWWGLPVRAIKFLKLLISQPKLSKRVA